MRKGRYARGKGTDKNRFIFCPNCGFRIDTTKITPTKEWHVEAVIKGYLTTEDGYAITTEDGKILLGESYYYPEVSGGCPFCGLGAFK